MDYKNILIQINIKGFQNIIFGKDLNHEKNHIYDYLLNCLYSVEAIIEFKKLLGVDYLPANITMLSSQVKKLKNECNDEAVKQKIINYFESNSDYIYLIDIAEKHCLTPILELVGQNRKLHFEKLGSFWHNDNGIRLDIFDENRSIK
jgi:hypothetical protein